jgi:hypothetical protein
VRVIRISRRALTDLDVPGQAGAVAASALDADQADRAEILQPAQ